MANRFTVFVVFAAVAQASSASAAEESSDLAAAQEATRTAWRELAEPVCKAVQDKSWPIEKARDQYRSSQMAGRTAFANVAPPCDDPSLLIEIGAFTTAFRDGIFEAIWEARNCQNYTETKAAIGNYRTQLPYEQFLRVFQKLAKYTGSLTPAVKSVKLVYESLFAEPEKLIEATCGGGQTIGPCATNEIHEKVDAGVKILYSWLAKGSLSSTILTSNVNH